MSGDLNDIELSAETLLHLLIQGMTYLEPELREGDPVWTLQADQDTEVTEEQVLSATPEELPIFFLVRNGKPLMAVVNYGAGRYEVQRLELTWQGDPELDPERIYEEINDVVGGQS